MRRSDEVVEVKERRLQPVREGVELADVAGADEGAVLHLPCLVQRRFCIESWNADAISPEGMSYGSERISLFKIR